MTNQFLKYEELKEEQQQAIKNEYEFEHSNAKFEHSILCSELDLYLFRIDTQGNIEHWKYCGDTEQEYFNS